MMTSLVWRAGAAEVDITPPINLSMDGYMARQGPSLGQYDPLLAQIVVIEDVSGRRLAIVTLDVLAVSAVFADPLRQSLAAQIGTDASAVVVCPSHTHCGPLGLQTWFPLGEGPQLDAVLVNMIGERLQAAATVALERLQPARLKAGASTVTGIGGNRNRSDTPVDSQVTTFVFENEAGTPFCILYHYACHPSVLGADTNFYLADFPGATRQRLKQVYPQAVSLFVNGALGDISTRYQRRDQSYAEVIRLGTRLADHIIALVSAAQPLDGALGWGELHLDLPFRALPEAVDAIPQVMPQDRITQTKAEGAIIQSKIRRAIGERTGQSMTLTWLRLGEWVMAAVPGEPFNALAVVLRECYPQALVLALANDYLGYFPTQEAIDSQTYEALSSPYDARAILGIESLLTAFLSNLKD